MPKDELRYLISEKGRYAERSFQYLVERYFPRSVFTPVSSDQHGFDGNLILQADTSLDNTVSVYFQVKHSVQVNTSQNSISIPIHNLDTFRSLMQHDYPYLALLDVESSYNNLLPYIEPKLYLVNLRSYFESRKGTFSAGDCIDVPKDNIVNLFSSQLLSAAVWCHRFSRHVEFYIREYMNNPEYLEELYAWTNQGYSPNMNVPSIFDNTIAGISTLPWHCRRTMNIFLGATSFICRALKMISSDSGKESFYTVAHESLSGVEANMFVLLKPFQLYGNELIRHKKARNCKFVRNFVLPAQQETYRAIQKSNFYYLAKYLTKKGIIVNFIQNVDDDDYFIIKNGPGIQLTNYFEKNESYRIKAISSKLPKFRDIIEQALEDPEFNDTADRRLRDLVFNGLSPSSLPKAERELELSLSVMPRLSMFPSKTRLYSIPDDYFRIMRGSRNA